MNDRSRVVLDVNTIVSGFLRGVGAPVEIAQHWRQGRIDVVLSEHIYNKVHEIWERPYFRKRHDEIDRALAVMLMREQATIVDPDPSVSGVCDDWEDDLVLGTAVAAEADYLVTGDHGLLEVGCYGGVSIISAREFMEKLDLERD